MEPSKLIKPPLVMGPLVKSIHHWNWHHPAMGQTWGTHVPTSDWDWNPTSPSWGLTISTPTYHPCLPWIISVKFRFLWWANPHFQDDDIDPFITHTQISHESWFNPHGYWYVSCIDPHFWVKSWYVSWLNQFCLYVVMHKSPHIDICHALNRHCLPLYRSFPQL